MKNPLKLLAALTLTGSSFSASAQGTKPMPKEEKTETKSEETMETKKEVKTATAKGTKMAHHGGKTHHTKMAAKTKM